MTAATSRETGGLRSRLRDLAARGAARVLSAVRGTAKRAVCYMTPVAKAIPASGYSSRRAITGSTTEARRAGTTQAARATASRNSVTTAKVVTSVGSMP